MANGNDEPRYSEEEFALILRKASEMRREGRPEEGSSKGLTLSEILQIAQEAGIDPELVSRAASLLPAAKASSSALARIFGGPSKYRMSRSVPGKVPGEDLGLILEVIRDVMQHQGTASEGFGGLEWKNSGGDVTTVAVNLSAREEETRLEITVERGGAGVLSYFIPFLPTAIAAGAIGGALGVDSLPEVLALVLSGLGTAWILGRTIFANGTRKWNETLPRLMDAMANRAAELATPSPKNLPAKEEEAGSPEA